MNTFWNGFQAGIAGTVLNTMFTSFFPRNFSWFNCGFMPMNDLYFPPMYSAFQTSLADSFARLSMFADYNRPIQFNLPYQFNLQNLYVPDASIFNNNFGGLYNSYDIGYGYADIFAPVKIKQDITPSQKTTAETAVKPATKTTVKPTFEPAVKPAVETTTDTKVNKKTDTLNDDERFKKMLAFIYEQEGGYVKSDDENGGAANYGISQTVYTEYLKNKGLQDKSVSQITKAEADEIYYNEYWLKSGADKITDDRLALMVFDTAVNMGCAKAKELYRQCNNDINKYKELRMQAYNDIVIKNPSKSKYLRGWTNRVNSAVEYNIA